MQSQLHGGASRERKLSMTLLSVMVVSLLLYLPDAIFHIVDFVNPSSKLASMYVQLHAILIVLCYANNLLNPISKTARIPDFRRALIVPFRKPLQRKQALVIPLKEI